MPTPTGPLPQRTPTSARPQTPSGASGEKAQASAPAAAPLASAPQPRTDKGDRDAQPGVESTQVSFKVPSFESHVTRSRTYAFGLDERGQPIELGSGRFAKAYLGEE